MRITGLYAAIAALLIVIFAVRVTLRRRAISVGIGNGGDAILARRVRVHANAAEYLPLALILLLILELNQTQPLLLHVFGCLLIVGRLLHAWGLSSSPGLTPGRGIGMVLTWLTIAVMALLLIWQTLALWVLT
ncbi:MAG TPA: MAPEG family protein [Rhodanobacteraceae bacterium]|nr:MAPEG family protein [Rhodanobacteraceae bacterium]